MRQRELVVAGALLVSVIASPAIAATPPASPAAAVAAAALSGPDFDSDGFADLAVGAPGECGDCVFYGAGAIHTAYGSAESDADVAPMEGPPAARAGAALVLRGTADGLVGTDEGLGGAGSRFWYIGGSGMPGDPELFDRLGWAIT